MVFDARTGHPVSLNREAKRIVGGLGLPGRSAEQLLEVLSWRRADGRELSMATSPLPEALRSATTVRAEEIVLSVPDGRRVTTLVNATPIQAEDGAVVSVVVTMQDLAPLEELERLRAEFLSLVSHELRAPLAAIKGSAATVLGGAPAPDPAEMLQFFRIINEQADHMRGLISDLLDAGHIEAGTLSVTPEPADVADLVEQARKTFLSGGGRHTVQIDLPPDLPRVRADRRRLVQVLNNLLANAATYSPAASPIRVAAVRDGVHVAVSVSDEGQGVPADRLPQSVQEVLAHRRRGAGTRDRGVGPGPGHLQGAGGGPRGPHLGRQRRRGPGHAGDLYDPGDRRRRQWRRGRPRPGRGRLAGDRARADVHPGGGRRPGDPAVCAGHAH